MFRAFYYKKTAICFCYGIPFFESHGGENTFFACWQQNGAAFFNKPEFKFYGKQKKNMYFVL